MYTPAFISCVLSVITQVRRIADDTAAESRRRRRRHHHLAAGAGGAGGGAMGGMGGGGGGLPREVVGFGNVPAGFMQGFHGQQNAARFRVSIALFRTALSMACVRCIMAW